MNLAGDKSFSVDEIADNIAASYLPLNDSGTFPYTAKIEADESFTLGYYDGGWKNAIKLKDTLMTYSDSAGLEHVVAELDSRGMFNSRLGSLATSGTTLSWNDDSNNQEGANGTLLLGTATGGPGPSSYYYCLNFIYATGSTTTRNITQLAVPYSSGGGLYTRTRYSGAWSAWTKLG